MNLSADSTFSASAAPLNFTEQKPEEKYKPRLVAEIDKINLLTCSLIFPYYLGDPTIFNKVLLSQLDN